MNILKREKQYENLKNLLNNSKEELHKNTYPLKASHLRAVYNSFTINNAYKKGSLVALTGEEFPQEILFALSIIPIDLQSMCAMLARSNSDVLNNCYRQMDNINMSKDICSNIRSSFSVAFADILPEPNMVFGNSIPCDGFSKLAYYISKMYDCTFLFLDTPDANDEKSIAYLSKQIENSFYDIVKNFNLKWDVIDILKTIRYSNEAKKYYLATLDLVKKYQLQSVQNELYELVVANLWGAKELVNVTKTLYQEALKLSEVASNNKKRILWIGQVPNYAYKFLDYLYDNVDVIYFASSKDEIVTLLDEKNPYESMAKRLISCSWNPFRRYDIITNICKDYNVDGVILQNPWGCRNLLGVTNILRTMLTKNKVKCLTIDADFMDREKFAYSQVVNRCTAFFEML